jgi:hypothetical protein
LAVSPATGLLSELLELQPLNPMKITVRLIDMRDLMPKVLSSAQGQVACLDTAD